MEVSGFIKIRGLDGEFDPGSHTSATFEMFQGASISLAPGDSALEVVVKSDEISTIGDVAQTIWEKQTDMIAAQNDYLDKVKDTFNARFINIPKVSDLRDKLIAAAAEEVIGFIASITTNAVVGMISEFLIGNLGDLIEFLKAVLVNHGKICDVMKAENTALLDMEQSRDNYFLRKEVLEMHDDMIDTLLRQVSDAEEAIERGEAKLPKGWKKWIKEMVGKAEDLEEWAEKATDGDTENNLPVPILPKLPDTNNIESIALYYSIKYGIRLVGEIVNNWMDKQNAKKEELIQAIEDLQFNDQTFDLGDLRIILANRALAIDYGDK